MIWYDMDRLYNDKKEYRYRDPHGVHNGNEIEWRAKKDQLMEMVYNVKDPLTRFILVEMLENWGS